MSRKLISVRLVYEDEMGFLVESLDREFADQWLDIINGYLCLQQTRAGHADSRLGALIEHWKIERADSPPD